MGSELDQFLACLSNKVQKRPFVTCEHTSGDDKLLKGTSVVPGQGSLQVLPHRIPPDSVFQRKGGSREIVGRGREGDKPLGNVT